MAMKRKRLYPCLLDTQVADNEQLAPVIWSSTPVLHTWQGWGVNEHRLSTMLWALMRGQQLPDQWTAPQRRPLQEAPSKMGHFPAQAATTCV